MYNPIKHFLFLLPLIVYVINAETIDDVQVDIVQNVTDCKRKSIDNDYITVHFKSSWSDGTPIADTYTRGVPVEIQLGTKMLSPGLDTGLRNMCVGEKRKLTMPANIGWLENNNVEKKEDEKEIIYEVELIEINDQTTLNTFKYLDLNGDQRISREEAEALVRMFMKALNTETLGIDTNYMVNFFMSLHDKNEDNYISQDEFLASLKETNEMGFDLDKDEL